MARARILRLLAVAAAFAGLLIQGGYRPPLTLDEWRAQQQAEAMEALQPPEPVAAAGAEATPTPLPSSEEAAAAPQAVPTPVPAANGSMAVDCNAETQEIETSCTYALDARFAIQIDVTQPPAGGYVGFQTRLLLSPDTVAYLAADAPSVEALWAGCALPLRNVAPDGSSVTFGCTSIPVPPEGSTFVGGVLRFELSCADDGVSSLILAPRSEEEPIGTAFVAAGGSSVVPAVQPANVVCGRGAPATPTPTPSGSPTVKPTGGATPTPTDGGPATPGTSVEKDIPIAGGRIESADGKVAIDFPADTVAEPLRIRISQRGASQFAPIPGHPFLSVWEFEAFARDRDMAKVDEFPDKISISTNYQPEDLFGLSPDTLQLWTWNAKEERWELLAGDHTPHTGRVSVEVDHFSIFAGTADENMIQAPFLDSFQTDLQTGASQVTLPLQVPPGRGGLQPNVALTYSSNRVNEMKDQLSQGSWVGAGWDLSVGSIRKVFVGENKDPRYYLEMNGVSDELIPDPGASDDNPWRTKRHDYLRIQEVGSCDLVNGQLGGGPITNPQAPCYWIATDKSGTRYFFGGTYGADTNTTRYYDLLWDMNPLNPPDEDDPSDKAFVLFYYRWDLLGVIDTHGNVIGYTYDQAIQLDNPNGSTGSQPWVYASYPKDISYNNGRATVSFLLGNTATEDPVYGGLPSLPLRPDSPRNLAANDPTGCVALQFIGGAGIKSAETRSLDKIEVKAGDTGLSPALVRSYDFQYTNTNFTRLPAPDCRPKAGTHQLEWVRQLGNDGSSELYRMIFQYTSKHFDFYLANGQTGCPTVEEPPCIHAFDRPFLTSATNGFGGTAMYAYTQKHLSGQQNWSREVVSERTLDDGGSSAPLVTRYVYDDGQGGDDGPFYHADGADYWNAEYRGFGFVKEFQGDASSLRPFTEHRFHTTGSTSEDKKAGLENDTRIYEANKLLARHITYNWGTRSLPAGCSSNCSDATFVSLTRVDTYEGPMNQPFGGTRLATEYDYDAAGNRVVERSLGKIGTSGDERTTFTRYHLPQNPEDPAFDVTQDKKWIMLPQFQQVYTSVHNLPELEVIYGQPNHADRVAETTYFYDGSGVFDAYGSAVPSGNDPPVGNLTGVHHWYGMSNVYYQYDSVGNLTAESVPTDIAIISQGSSATIPAGVKKTTYVYSPDNSRQRTFPDSFTDAEGNAATISWNEHMGFPTTRLDPNGNAVNFVYNDPHGRLTAVHDSVSGSTPVLEHSYLWGPGGLNATVTRHFYDATGFTMESHCYDGFGREMQSRQGFSPGANAQDSIVETTYNEQGQVKYRSQAFLGTNNLGGCSEPETPGIEKTLYTYNALGEVTETENPDGTSRTTERSGLITTATDENGHEIETFGDAYGRLTKVNEYMNSTSYATTTYSYDTLGNLRFVTDAHNHQTEMRYDQLGRKTEMFDPDMGHWTYPGYDAAGNLTEQVDARGQRIAMVYDGLSRLTKKCYSVTDDTCKNPSTVAEATYSYDVAGYSPSICGAGMLDRGRGHLGTMVDESGTTTWCYDLRGRQAIEQRAVTGAANPYGVARVFDGLNRPLLTIYRLNVLSDTDPGNEWLWSTYNATSGQPGSVAADNHGVTGDEVTLVSSATYDASLRPDVVTFGNGMTTNYDYDQERGWLTRTFTQRTGSTIQDLRYTQYDPAGNVKRIEDWSASPTEMVTFDYDDLDRLTQVNNAGNGYSAGYDYNSIGNVVQINEGSSQRYLKYDAGHKPHAVRLVDNNVTASATTIDRAYTYDLNGNVVGLAEGTAAQSVDSDQDGCPNGAERGTTNHAICHVRSPAYFWDVYNTPNPNATPQYDCVVDIDDLFRVAGRAFQVGDARADPLSPAPAAGYHPGFDRTKTGPGPTELGPPDGAIGVDEIYWVAAQVGTSGGCTPFAQTFAYDEENRLTAHTEGGITTTYSYDGQGTLVAKAAGGAAPKVYIADAFEKDTAPGGGVTSYFWFGGARAAMRAGGTLSYLLADSLGSTTKMVNGSGSVTSSEKYYPFGATRSGATVATDKAFTGHQREDADLYFMKARFYDPLVGRFLQPDTIVPDPKNPQALNRYNYVGNNPTRYIDPTGHDLFDSVMASVGSAVARFSGASEPAPVPDPPATPCPPWVSCIESGPACGFLAFVCGLTDFAISLYVQPGIDLYVGVTGRDVHWNKVSRQEQLAAQISVLLLLAGGEETGGASRLVGRLLVREAGGEGARVLVNKAIGGAAADQIASRFAGALREQTLPTALGPRRVDVLTSSGLAIESKVGRTALTANIQQQIAKDVDLMTSNPRVNSVLWAFSESPVTGLAGPTDPLASALKRAGIAWVVMR